MYNKFNLPIDNLISRPIESAKKKQEELCSSYLKDLKQLQEEYDSLPTKQEVIDQIMDSYRAGKLGEMDKEELDMYISFWVDHINHKE